MIDDYVQLITNVGFPIALCMYFILRFEKTIKENTTVVRELVKIQSKILRFESTIKENTRVIRELVKIIQSKRKL